MAEKEKRQMVQKSDNEFVKSRIELHCIVPFANTIIPDSRKKNQPLRTRTFPNLRTMNGLRFIGGIGTSGCSRAECFPLPVQPAFGRTRKIPPGDSARGDFFTLSRQALTQLLAGVLDGSLSGCQNYRAYGVFSHTILKHPSLSHSIIVV